MKEKVYLTPSLIFISFFVFFISCDKKDKKINTNSISCIDSLHTYYSTSLKSINDPKKALENIDIYISKAQSLKLNSLVYKGYMLKTRILGRQKKYNQAIKDSEFLLKIATKNNDSSYIGKAANKLGLYYSQLSDYTNAFKYYNKSFEIHRNLNDSTLASKRLLYMANAQRFLGDYVASNITAIDGLNYLGVESDLKTEAEIYFAIAVNYRELTDFKQAYYWIEKAIQIGNKKKFVKQVRNILNYKNTKANVLGDLGQYEKAITIFDELLNDSILKNNPSEYARVMSNLGKIKWLHNKNDESEAILLKALELRKKRNSPSNMIASHVHLSKYYKEKDRKKAIYHARQAKHHALLLKNQLSILEALNIIINLNAATLEEYQEYQRINNYLVNIRKNIRQIYAPTKFENERLSIEKEKKEKKVIEQKSQMNWIIVIFSLIVIIILLYIIQRNKLQKERRKRLIEQSKREKIQTAYAVENRISKKVHDNIANEIHLIKMLVTNHVDEEKVLQKLHSLYDKARDISRENNDIDFKNYSNELNEMIKNFIGDKTDVFIIGENTINWRAYSNVKKIVLFRVIQELMVNMKKHSESSEVSIVFEDKKKSLKILYIDDGIGFSISNVKNKNGLLIMENRIEAIDGQIKFEEKRKRGVKAQLVIPSEN